MLNWLLQTLSVTRFSLQTLPERKGTALSSIFGIAGVVAVLVGVLSIAQGIRLMVQNSADPDNAIVLRSGSDSEMMSFFSGPQTEVIDDAPGLARDEEGALSSPELFVIINLPKRSTGTELASCCATPGAPKEPALFPVASTTQPTSR